MKKIINKSAHLLIIALAHLLISSSIFAQAPQKMSYQAVIRNSNDSLLISTSVGMRISLLQSSPTGTVVFSEIQTATTNANGLVSLQIGMGAALSGTFAGIDWAAGPYYVKTETDITGGTNYTITSSNEILSVPYALFSANGTPGPAGPIGLTGETGAQGAIGLTGETGPAGAQGIQGETGATGPQGPQGNDGAQGPTGAQGLIGLTGAVGAQGPIGLTGANGAVGATGPQGNQGIQGETGAAGATGAVGATGAQGDQGIQGATGAVGATGPTGTNGTNGTNGAVGAIGLTGPAGAQGIQGLTGPAGATGPTGLTGPAGSNGTNGAVGATGPTGTNGTNGTNGQSAYQAAVSNGFVGTEAQWLTSLQGAQGIQGVAGATGAQGIAGTNGTNGTVGATGPQGEIGLTGAAATFTFGDIKTGMQSIDHNGWVKLDGRAKSSLTATQQTQATALGIGTSLPDATNAFLVQNGSAVGTVAGSSTKTITQANLPNVTLTGSTNSAGSHAHSIPVSSPINFSSGWNTAYFLQPTTTTISSGSHEHTLTTSSLNGDVTQTTFDVTPKTLSVNTFIYIGN